MCHKAEREFSLCYSEEGIEICNTINFNCFTITYAAMSYIKFKTVTSFIFAFALLMYNNLIANESLTNYARHSARDRSVIVTSESGQQIRITPYGNHIVRVQAVRAGEKYFADDRYEMVESHKWKGSVSINDEGDAVLLSSPESTGFSVRVNKNPLRLSFIVNSDKQTLLQERNSIVWVEDSVQASFEYDTAEHFTGLGHGFFGRAQSIDLRGEKISRSYGTMHGQQAPLNVPFYLSSKGYGIFLNSTFPNEFNFGKDGDYGISLFGGGQLDFFFILGPELTSIIDRYTQLTGRPRMPLKAFFGLALSDKGHDHASATPSDEQWWKDKITQHRNAGFPLDHIVNDNRWRAGGGKRCESYFDWDAERYPDPAEYERWIRKNGLITTLDFNRCIASHSDGWKKKFNIPESRLIDFNDSAPDLTKKEVRSWWWNLMWRKSLNPKLKFPGDALWIDEFDEMGKTEVTAKLGNGKTWLEMRNYWFFLVAKALVQEGWDKNFKDTKRPFVWVRGMTSGGQRYATLWSGDIDQTYDDMKTQVRGMQLAGISGFPFWGHDAGGFRFADTIPGPSDALYRQWSMAFGSFTPYWKPHGIGISRWPLDRPEEVQHDAKKYSELRYMLMPYTYTYAHVAAETGIPMTRAMILDHQNDSSAWKNDLQYMWGNEMLVAPNCSDSGNVSVWLPKGNWYDFWNDAQLKGDQTISYPAPLGKLPLFVKAGSIIPAANYALSTAFMRGDSLTIHVYTGADGSFSLYEDDGITERYKSKGEKRITNISFTQESSFIAIHAAQGSYTSAVKSRAYRVIVHGLTHPQIFSVNGVELGQLQTDREAIAAQEGLVWNESKKQLSIYIKSTPVSQSLSIQPIIN